MPFNMLRAAMILEKEAVQGFHASGWAHGPALHLAEAVEAVAEGNVVPAVGRCGCHVDLDMNLTETIDVLVTVNLGIVHEVVELGQAEVASEHDLATLIVQ